MIVAFPSGKTLELEEVYHPSHCKWQHWWNDYRYACDIKMVY